MSGLSEVIASLEELAYRDGKAYRRLKRGLWVKVETTADEYVLACGIARELPFAPSPEEEATVAAALGPAFVNAWQRRTDVRGPLEKRYNVSETTYIKTGGQG